MAGVKVLSLTPRLSRNPKVPKPKAPIGVPKAPGLKMTMGKPGTGIPKLPSVGNVKTSKIF